MVMKCVHLLVYVLTIVMNVFCTAYGKFCKTLSVLLNSFPVTMIRSAQLNQALGGKQFTERTFKQRMGAMWHILVDHLVLFVLAVFPIVDSEPWTNSGAGLNAVNGLYE